MDYNLIHAINLILIFVPKGWSSPVGARVRDEFNLSRNQWDWVGSIVTIGAAISCLPIGYLMKTFGRKWTMIGLVVPFLIGYEKYCEF